MAFWESAKELAKQLKDLNDKLLTTGLEFEHLKQTSSQALHEVKSLVEKMATRLEQVEKEHIKERAELLAKIDLVDGRLSMISENALHLAVQDIAAKMLAGSSKVGDVRSEGLPAALLDGSTRDGGSTSNS